MLTLCHFGLDSFLPHVNDDYIAEPRRLLPLPARRGLLSGLQVIFLDEAQVRAARVRDGAHTQIYYNADSVGAFSPSYIDSLY
jgi:hypothetical protein